MDSAPADPVVDTEPDIPCRMRDGVILRADVYRPRTDELLPTLVMRLPYGKRVWAAEGVPSPRQLAAAGYVVVVQDVRGCYASEGRLNPNLQELDDGSDTVAWAAGLPGSNGVVGTFGPSYLAHVQWAAALRGAESLRSMIAMVSPNHSGVDGYYVRGGVNELSRLGWAHGAAATGDAERRGEVPLVHPAESLQQRFDSGSVYGARPFRKLVSDEPLLGAGLEIWSRPQAELADDPTMTAGRYEQIEQPVFLIGGWFDAFLGSTLAQFEGLQNRPGGRGGSQLVVGPWSHMQAGSRLGELDFGPAAAHTDMGADISLEEQHIRWFDATLKGASEPLRELAPVRLFVMGENTWESFTEFPPRRARPSQWFLHPGGGLSRSRPQAGGSQSYRYDPQDPAPTVGGATLVAGYDPGPMDQKVLHERADVLSFVSDPLDEPLRVVGYLAATLFASTSAPDTDFLVRLCDDHPDGRSIVMADGIIRASARDSYDHDGFRGPVPPTPVVPGQVYEYRFNLWATAHTFLPGHRIRVDVTSSSFPRWDPNLNTGESSWDSAASQPAMQTIHLGGRLASQLTLPILTAPTADTTEYPDE